MHDPTRRGLLGGCAVALSGCVGLFGNDSSKPVYDTVTLTVRFSGHWTGSITFEDTDGMTRNVSLPGHRMGGPRTQYVFPDDFGDMGPPSVTALCPPLSAFVRPGDAQPNPNNPLEVALGVEGDIVARTTATTDDSVQVEYDPTTD